MQKDLLWMKIATLEKTGASKENPLKKVNVLSASFYLFTFPHNSHCNCFWSWACCKPAYVLRKLPPSHVGSSGNVKTSKLLSLSN